MNDHLESETICVTVNGSNVELAGGTTVATLLSAYLPANPGGKGVAIAIDRQVVSRSLWSQTSIRDGDHIEIITAAPGG